MRKILGVLFLVACGDPRAAFVGSYKGTTEFTTQTNSGPVVDVGTADFTVTEQAGNDRLLFSVGCMFTARAVDADTLQFDPISCPTVHSTANSGASADFTQTFESGTGILTNKTLTLSQSGYYVGTNYSDGSHDSRYDISLSVTATKQ